VRSLDSRGGWAHDGGSGEGAGFWAASGSATLLFWVPARLTSCKRRLLVPRFVVLASGRAASPAPLRGRPSEPCSVGRPPLETSSIALSAGVSHAMIRLRAERKFAAFVASILVDGRGPYPLLGRQASEGPALVVLTAIRRRASLPRNVGPAGVRLSAGVSARLADTLDGPGPELCGGSGPLFCWGTRCAPAGSEESHSRR
jgi:hypothetical protein